MSLSKQLLAVLFVILVVENVSLEPKEQHPFRHKRLSHPNLVSAISNSLDEDLEDLIPNLPDDQFETQEKLKCPTCKQHGVQITPEDLKSLRIEFLKNEILRKLRLSERPKISFPKLPQPIADGITIQYNPEVDESNKRLDDYYAKTTQKIVFLNEGEWI
jgi:TGF-beta receptor